MIDVIAYNQDNYAYFVQTKSYNLLVDAGNFEDIASYLDRQQKKPDYILLTHNHGDHIADALKLKNHYQAQIIASQALPMDDKSLDETQSIALGLSFISTPGHTEDSGLWLLNENNEPLAIFSGDVIFSCGSGRQFQGISENLYKAMEKINQLDGRYQLCCGHEYTETNLAFCRQIFPQDEALHHYEFEVLSQRMAHKPTLPILLSKEKQINPFLRFNDNALWPYIDAENAVDFILKLRKLRDQY